MVVWCFRGVGDVIFLCIRCEYDVVSRLSAASLNTTTYCDSSTASSTIYKYLQ